MSCVLSPISLDNGDGALARGRNIFLNLASDLRRLVFYLLSPLIRELEGWQVERWLPGGNVSPNLTSDSRRVDDVPTPSKMVKEGRETCGWDREINVSQDLASDPRRPNGGSSTSLVHVER